jgi:hypothetical protein
MFMEVLILQTFNFKQTKFYSVQKLPRRIRFGSFYFIQNHCNVSMNLCNLTPHFFFKNKEKINAKPTIPRSTIRLPNCPKRFICKK